jgi:hypothetical protein
MQLRFTDASLSAFVVKFFGYAHFGTAIGVHFFTIGVAQAWQYPITLWAHAVDSFDGVNALFLSLSLSFFVFVAYVHRLERRLDRAAAAAAHITEGGGDAVTRALDDVVEAPAESAALLIDDVDVDVANLRRRSSAITSATLITRM